MLEDSNLNGDEEDQKSHQSQSGPKQNNLKEEDRAQPSSSNELKDSNAPPPLVEDSKTEEDQSETSNSQDKTLKKPDKILPCPRCNSMDTKFCYFNNYNVNQPRHFCKNCQRYWTAGGTMRNVPVGAGRRKNKNVVSQFRPLTVPEAFQNARVDPTGKVLAFNPDTPLCESMVSVLNIADKSIRSNSRNGELGISVSQGCKENGDDYSADLLPLRVQRTNSPISPPTFSPASFPLPFYSTTPPYWGCAGPGIWNVPFVIPPTPAPSSGPNSPTLGKHSREENPIKPADLEEETQKESNSEKCLWVPKTLRIDDPGEAAKSSIWATLGIKNDGVESVGGGGGGLFKAFQSQSKGDEKTQVQETSTVLQANPAALSRSVSFHESS
ncbi:hypothetical protein DH2020_037894 [Rehmannia glutinosa]|uniref:Dof-type domain-containing protein n=1 Tax=Rehmannia glutinosa TaxID=99300 RepID=A0ABR0V042_REHGL